MFCYKSLNRPTIDLKLQGQLAPDQGPTVKGLACAVAAFELTGQQTYRLTGLSVYRDSGWPSGR